MANKKQSKEEQQDFIMRGTDPGAASEIEAKVDAMLQLDKEKHALKPESNNHSVSGAPLLPDEKLPDFDKITKSSAEPRDIKETTQKPQVDTLAEQPAKVGDEIGIESSATNKAVDDISKAESDRMLAIDDAKAELQANGTALKHKSRFSRLKTAIKNWWANPRARWATIASVFLIVLVVSMIPTSRYFALNLFGVRASTSMKIIDEKTGQPLKNVEVSLSGKANRTDKEGQVKLSGVKLGSQKLSVKKPAFADYSKDLTIGWGSNPLGDVRLSAVGSRYSFVLTDFLSDKPIVSAEAVSGEYNAAANEKGEIVLVVNDQNDKDVEISINAEHYRSEKVTLPVGSKDMNKLQLVPSRKQAFVSKRSGKLDLYKIDVDGKNEQKVMEGTGSEQEDRIAILAHPTKDVVAFVSTRENQHNKDGYALSALNIVDLDTNEARKITFSERIQLVDFIGDKLVYVKITEGASAASANRHRLLSYDIDKDEEKELASTNYFNDVMSAGGAIYYSPAAYNVNGSVGLFKINPDGTDKKQIYNSEVWNLFRTSYYKIAASIGQEWYEYDIGSSGLTKLGGAPPVLKSRVYANSPNGKKSAWVDERDGKGVLIIYDLDTNEDKVLQTQSGLKNPIRWLDNEHLVYRVTNNSETADYVITLSGQSKKIIDVTNASGLDRWYYY